VSQAEAAMWPSKGAFIGERSGNITGAQSLDEFDYLIVGAGARQRFGEPAVRSAGRQGAVGRSGRDLTPGSEPADVRSVFPMAAFNGSYMCRHRVHWRRADDSPEVPFPQGRILGGSSTVMGMWRCAARRRITWSGSWRVPGLGWDDVLPFFRKLETDCDFDGRCTASKVRFRSAASRSRIGP